MYNLNAFNGFGPRFNGIEIDMLSVRDADCIVLTQWTDFGPQRILIDGGDEADTPTIREFLRAMNFTSFWAVVCSHLHNDHSRGLIKLVQDRSITIHNGWMHDIRNHVGAEALRRASSGNSSNAEGVKQVWENTKALASAFASRNITPQEPFAGAGIAAYPLMTVLGPSRAFYQQVLEEFTKVDLPQTSPSLFAALSGLGSAQTTPKYPSFASMLPPALTPPHAYGQLRPSLAGVLKDSSVKENPNTQPFNDSSTIIGVIFGGDKLLFTADAGSDALDRIPAAWRNLLWMQVPHHGSDGNLSQSNIERFCPKFANISARGDTSHPSKAIVNGLIKVGAQVFSTHTLNPGHLWFRLASVPSRASSGYGPAVPLKGTSVPIMPLDWFSRVSNVR